MAVGLVEANCLINVPKVQGPLTLPVLSQKFHVRVGSSTTNVSVISMQFCRIKSRVVKAVVLFKMFVLLKVLVLFKVLVLPLEVLVLLRGTRSVDSAFVKLDIETVSFASNL